MATYLIRPANGGGTRVVGDSALQFFQSQGWVVVDTMNDAAPPFYTADESDLRYVETAGISDPAHPDGAELREFFEEKIKRDGATAGQVPILQADGTLAFGAGSGGGGGTGTVTSVNNVSPVSGNVTLGASDVGAATAADITSAVGGTLRVVRHTGGTDPVRPATANPVLWITPDANRPATNGTVSGGSYAAVNNLDLLWTY